MDKPKIFSMPFAIIYPLYIKKVERKGQSKADVDRIISWLTGYDAKQLQRQIDTGVDNQSFFAQAPAINPNASKITGLICGVRVEDIEDETMQKIRYLDKLIDELANGKPITKILRA